MVLTRTCGTCFVNYLNSDQTLVDIVTSCLVVGQKNCSKPSRKVSGWSQCKLGQTPYVTHFCRGISPTKGKGPCVRSQEQTVVVHQCNMYVRVLVMISGFVAVMHRPFVCLSRNSMPKLLPRMERNNCMRAF